MNYSLYNIYDGWYFYYTAQEAHCTQKLVLKTYMCTVLAGKFSFLFSTFYNTKNLLLWYLS